MLNFIILAILAVQPEASTPTILPGEVPQDISVCPVPKEKP